ncbi:MAG TPA: hypothetical protein VF552_04245 [Allosphingosinicella sp.]|jgi:hypothetical protein
MELSAVTAELHVFDGEVKWATPIRLAISFADGSHLRLSGAGDGQTLCVDRQQLEPPVDMGEYGRTAIFDLTDRLDATLRSAVVGSPVAIRLPSDQLVGLALPREVGDSFCVWIDGDEFHWGTEGELMRHEWLPGEQPVLAGNLDG